MYQSGSTFNQTFSQNIVLRRKISHLDPQFWLVPGGFLGGGGVGLAVFNLVQCLFTRMVAKLDLQITPEAASIVNIQKQLKKAQ